VTACIHGVKQKPAKKISVLKKLTRMVLFINALILVLPVDIGPQRFNLTFLLFLDSFFNRFLMIDYKWFFMFHNPSQKEDTMAKRRGKQVSFDAMVKFFMQYYHIPTKKDIDKVLERMDRLEQLIKATGKGRRAPVTGPDLNKLASGKSAMTATDMALDVIKRFRKGVGFSEIQAKTGFGEKKLRNIIFRLNKEKKIVRKSRGVYIAS
jgi:hypothetical protein